MVVRVLLVATEPATDQVAVSSSVEVDTGDPHWNTRLVEAITQQASQGARWLGEHVRGAFLEPPPAAPEFVPLAAVLPRAG
jgi:hypothetical protein